MGDVYYDPYDYDIDRDPHPVWKRMRDEHPLYYNEKYDFFALSRFTDVLDASRDWQTFSSAHGSVLELLDAPMEHVDMLRSILFEDPPIHDVHRSILNRVFTPRRVAALEPRVRELCAQYLDPFVGQNGFDFVQDFGAKLPMMVIGSLLGVPPEDQDLVREASDEMLHHDEHQQGMNIDALARLHDYFVGLVAERRSAPRDDLVSDLVQAEFTDEHGVTRPLGDDELLNFVQLLAAAGNETVARLMGWAAYALAANPDQRQLLVDDPGLMAGAVEETLRYEPPSPVQARLVMRDVELHDQDVAEGSKLLLLTGAAGRDERVFADPDRYDVRRKVDHHVSFGHGVHFCLGAALARLEARIGLEEALNRFPSWDVDEDNAEMVHTSTVRGWARLPIKIGR